jgi:short-subunit dehydrogenase
MNLKVNPAIAGQVAIVTGASSGIGESTAREFARAGAITVLAARRAERLERLAEEIRQMGGVALPVPTDLTDPHRISNLVQKTLSNFARIDILANIAGWGHYDWFEELTTENLRKPYDANIIGMAELIGQVLPTMKAQSSGFILNMSSYASKVAVPPLTVYASTKSAVDGLTDGLRRELAPWGIKVMRIHPSAVTGTEFKEKAVTDGGVTYQTLPLGRVSREQVAKEIVKLIEQPRRSLFVGRLYDVAVFLNTWFPAFIDWKGISWVRSQRQKELPRSHGIASVHYDGSSSMPLAMLTPGIVLARRFLKKRFQTSSSSA